MGEKREKWADIVKENCGEEWLSYCLRCVHAQTDPYASDMSWECVTCDPVVKIPHSNFEPRPEVEKPMPDCIMDEVSYR